MNETNKVPTLEIYLTNLQAYNNGSLIGKWVHLPVTAEEFQKDLKTIGIGRENEYGEVAEEWFVTDYNSVIPKISSLDDTGEYPDLNKLNQVAADYDNLPSWEQDTVQTLMETSYAPKNLNELGNLLNDSYALEDIIIIPNGADDEELADYYIEEIYGTVSGMGSETIEEYFDEAQYGREIKMEESGEDVGWDYIEYGELEPDDDEPDYDEEIELDLDEDRETLQELNPGDSADGILEGLPDIDGTLDLKLVNPNFVPDYLEDGITDSVWISLPIEKEDYLQALCNIGVGNPPDGSENETFQIAEVVSRIPGISKMNEQSPFIQNEIDTLNQIARDYDELDRTQQNTLDLLSETSAYPGTLNELDSILTNEGYGIRNNGLETVRVYEDCADNAAYGEYWINEIGLPEHPEYYFDYGAYGRDLRMDLTGEDLENGDFLQLGADFQLDNDELYISEDLFEEPEEEEEREENHPFDRRSQFLKKLQPVRDLQTQTKLQKEQQKDEAEPERDSSQKEKPHD